MKPWTVIICVACISVACLLAPSGLHAADVSLPAHALQKGPIYRPADRARLDAVIPRSPEAQSVWNSDGCWRSCERQCNVSFQGRLASEPSGPAIAGTDRCDRGCLRACRTQGGPFLNLAD